MNILLTFIFLLLGNVLLGQSPKEIRCRIAGTITPVKQPKSNDCWITVTTMMLSWKENRKYTVAQVAKRLGNPWNAFYIKNTGLSEEKQEMFVKKVGLKSEPPANYLLQAYLDFIKEFGPVWITTGNGFSAHAKLLIGIEGKGDYDNTDFIFIDPALGKVIRTDALKFMKEFEEEAYVANEEKWERLRIQIYHF